MRSEPGLPTATGRQTAAVVGTYLRRHRLLLAAAVLAFGISSAGALALPFGLGRIVDIAAEGRGATAVWAVAGLMLGGVILAAVSGSLGRLATAVLTERFLAEIREALVAAGLGLGRRQIESTGHGDLVSRASDDIARASAELPRTVPGLVSSSFSLVLTAAGMAVLHPAFALTFAVALPIQLAGLRWYLRTAPALYAAERAALAVRAQRLLGSLRALVTVQAFSLAQRRADETAEASWDVVRWTMRARAALNTFFSRLNLAECAGMMTILVLSFLLVGRGEITVGEATAAMLFFLHLFGPMGQLLLLVDDLQVAGAALARVIGVIHTRPEHEDRRRTDAAGAALVVRDLSYAYDEGMPVLTGLELDLAPGRQVALVGSSGAGKSTFAALVAGTMPARQGRIALSPEAARSLLLITQEVHVFAGTVRENLTLAAPQRDDRAVREALEQVGAWPSIAALPEGLDTVVGGSGHPLTLAQAQLLALARVVLADPALVLLDEPTAEAGSRHGDLLDRAAGAAMAGRASLIIAHRLDQAAGADEILVLEAGRVVERGNHRDLVAAGGSYAELWSAWQRYR